MEGDSEKTHRVVISGIAGRFPNADNVTELKFNLLNSIDCTTTEHDRWMDYDSSIIPHHIGKCSAIEKFDRVFFGVHTKLTNSMDPMSRLLMEHTFEAIIDAGINPKNLRGQNISVYAATNISEMEKTMVTLHKVADGFGIVGLSRGMIANRVSFFLGLTGPSVNMDSGCTSSASALNRAYLDIKNGHCDAAIVAGCVLCLHPHVSYHMKALGLLSTDGKTRSFDNCADGHTRSDSSVVLYLQRSDHAKRIYQEIVHVEEVFSPGEHVNTLIHPSIESQIQVMQSAMTKSGLTADDVSFMEATGIGMRKHDADELRAIDMVYKSRQEPLLLGSIRSNLGNTIPANTANSILKIIIASETGVIPPNSHYETPNSEATCLLNGRVRILTEKTPWIGPYSSVHSIDQGGGVANVILKAPNIEKINNGLPNDKLQRIVVVSGRTKKAVKKILRYVEERPVDVEFLQLMYDVYSSGIDGYLYRGYTILSPDNSGGIKTNEIEFYSAEISEVWWIFSGMGSQWVGMGEALLKLPIFEAAIKKCDKVLKPLGYDIYKVITDKDPHTFDNIVNSFIGIAAIQIGLVDVLRAVGLEPDRLIGHSVGELGCAYADGCFSAEQMILAALSRGLASIETELIEGSMAAVGLGYEDVESLCPADIDVACHNGPDSSTISGPAKSMKEFVTKLTEKGIFAKEVACSKIAYHSRYISAAGSKLLERLQKVIPEPKPRSKKWLSTSVPRSEWNTLKARLSSAEYHTNNLLNPVLFDETSRLIPDNAICIEIAPHGLLQAILKKSLPKSCLNIPLAKRGHPDNFEVLLTALGKMYCAGLRTMLANLYPKVNYPVGRGTPSLSSLITWDHSQDWFVYYYNKKEKYKGAAQTVEIDLKDSTFSYLRGNTIDGKTIVPLSFCLMKIWEILKSYSEENATSCVFDNVQIRKLIIIIPDDGKIRLSFMIPKGSGQFEVSDTEAVVLTGTIKITQDPKLERLNLFDSKKDTNQIYELDANDFYKEMKMRGFGYNEKFKTMSRCSINEKEGILKWNNDWVNYIDGALQFHIFKRDTRQLEVPLSICKILIDEDFHKSAIKLTNEVPIFADDKVNCLSSGGLEMQGIKLSVIPKYLEQEKLSADTFNVIPNLDESVISINQALRLVLQIVFENVFSSKMPVIQIIRSNNVQHIPSGSMNYIPETSLFKIDCDVCYEDTRFNKTLTILEDEISSYDINKISKKLEDGKFILVFVNSNQRKSIIEIIESAGLKIVFIRKLNSEYIVLLKKKRIISKFYTFYISRNISGSLKNVEEIKLRSDNERIALIVKSGIDIRLTDLSSVLKSRLNLEKIRIFDFRNSNLSDHSLLELIEKQLEFDLFVNILNPDNTWATLCRTAVSLKPKLCKNWRANQKSLHDPYTYVWTEGPGTLNSFDMVKVEYSSLNPQDLLIANKTFGTRSLKHLGKSRIEPLSIGLEFSGTDANGNNVMGMKFGNSMANYVNVDYDWLWSIPMSWSLEDAATVPLSYIIAYSTCYLKAKIEANDTVIITNPCTIFGSAILNLVLQKKCNMFVRCDTEEERKILQSIHPEMSDIRMFKSTDDNLRKSIGQSVDVLIVDDSKDIEFYIPLLQHHTRVVLISDFNDNKIHEHIGMEFLLKNISIFSVVPEKIFSSDSNTKKFLSKLLMDGIDAGHVKPLPRISFCRENLDKALANIRQNRLHKKILIKINSEESNTDEALAIPRLYCLESHSYIILEGLTEFGLELIDWLITRGAKNFSVTSISKVDNGYTRLRSKYWKDYGINISVHEEFNYSDKANIVALFEESQCFGPLNGLFDLRAMNSRNNKLLNSFDAATVAIEEESRRFYAKLQWFVICSGTKDVTIANQLEHENYTSCSSIRVIEDVLRKRKADGLPGLLINWEFIDTTETRHDTIENNIILPPASKCWQKLDDILGTDDHIVQVSYAYPKKNEVEQESLDDSVQTLNHDAEDYKSFTASLYVNDGVHTEYHGLEAII